MAGSCGALLIGCEALSGAMQVQAADEGPTMSRERVVAELHEAQRLGLITVGEESIPVFTEEQLRMIAQAGDRADATQAAAAKPH
jgi:hypothetical protein